MGIPGRRKRLGSTSNANDGGEFTAKKWKEGVGSLGGKLRTGDEGRSDQMDRAGVLLKACEDDQVLPGVW